MRDRDIVTGPPAIQHLLDSFPNAHVHFGPHASPMHFAARLDMPDFIVLEHAACWVFARDLGEGVYDTHWFCPIGVNLDSLRLMLRHLFDDHGAKELVGETPRGHHNERAARAVSRAVGAVKEGRRYALTRERFMTYNGSKIKP